MLPHSTRPSPNSGWVGIRIVLFEACSGFTRVTARTLAQPPSCGTHARRGRPLSRGFDGTSCPATPPVCYQLNRQLAGWNPPPQVFRAVEAHQSLRTSRCSQLWSSPIVRTVSAPPLQEDGEITGRPNHQSGRIFPNSPIGLRPTVGTPTWWANTEVMRTRMIRWRVLLGIRRRIEFAVSIVAPHAA